MRFARLGGLALALCVAAGCERPDGCAARSVECGDARALAEARAWFEGSRPRYRVALERAGGWLDGLDVDPVELRGRGIKGKKKLVEALDSYRRLFLVSPAGAERARLAARFARLAAVTYEDRYHDMLEIDDRTFKQDATSYLRAVVLMELMGLETRRYRAEVARVKPRLDGHMRERGPHQRRAFHGYYRHLGLEEPFPLGDALAEGVIARRPEPASLDRNDVYALTHEIFGPYEFGERLDVRPFSAGDEAYLRRVLPALTERYVERGDADLVAELVACLRYLRFVDLDAYRDGLELLFATQKPDGSWGRYERQRARLGDYVRQGLELHTTMVAMAALTVAFHEPWNRGVAPPCLPGPVEGEAPPSR